MWISKKVMLIVVLCVVAIAGTLGGVALVGAADDSSTNTTDTVQINLLDKVAEIYEQNTGTAIDPAELEKAFIEAGSSIREERIDAILQRLVEDGRLTQEQADEWKAWWESRPDTAVSDEFKTWLESRPELPEGFGFGFGELKPFARGEGGCYNFNFRGDDTGPIMRGWMRGANN